jgi:hypothetical protein
VGEGTRGAESGGVGPSRMVRWWVYERFESAGAEARDVLRPDDEKHLLGPSRNTVGNRRHEGTHDTFIPSAALSART